MLQTRLQTAVCETLMLDVVAPEAHQNDCSYVRELSRPTFDSLSKHLAWWAVTRMSLKNCQNLEVGTYVGMGACPGQYGTINFLKMRSFLIGFYILCNYS